MSKLSVSGDNNHAVARGYVRLAGLPHSRSVIDYLNAASSSTDSGVGEGERRPYDAPLELDACSRSNIVTARTRFFEEKSRSSSPATPSQRRSRSATPRVDDDQHQPSNPDRGGSPSTPRGARHLPTARSTQAVPSTSIQAYQNRRVPVSAVHVSESILPVNNAAVNNETDELKVLTQSQLNIVKFSIFSFIL